MHREVVVSVLGGAQDMPGHSLEQPDVTRPGIGLGDTKGPFQPQFFCNSVLLPDLFDMYAHTNKRRPNLCWKVIVLISTFSDSRYTRVFYWTSMSYHCFLSNEIAGQMLLLEVGQLLICNEAPAIISI